MLHAAWSDVKKSKRAKVGSAIRIRTDALGAVEAGSAETLIRTTNARRRRAGLPRSGSSWSIRRVPAPQALPFESPAQGAQKKQKGHPKVARGGFKSWLAGRMDR